MNRLNVLIGASIGIVFALLSCSKTPMTQKLYFQTGRAQIFLPTTEETKTARLSERVDIQTTVDTLASTVKDRAEEGKGSITLETFTIVADRPQIKISTVRNGYVNLAFIVTLPKIFMDDNYQIQLKPYLLNGTTKQAMPPMVLQGRKFHNIQEAQYEHLDSLKGTLIDSTQYEEVYFDHDRYNSFLKMLQGRQFDRYKRNFNLMRGYNRWRRIMEARQLLFSIQNMATYDSRVASKSLSMLQRAFEVDMDGGDSIPIRSKHTKFYNPERRRITLTHWSRALRRDDVPRAYLKFYDLDWTSDSLRNKTVTRLDSLDIAKHTFLYKDIAKNEVLRENMDVYSSHILRFPRVENPHMIDSIQTDKDFVYMYSRDIEVKEGLQRRLRVVLESHVMATDESSWKQMEVDTLNFVVSGMNDLADLTLIERFEGERRVEYQQGLNRLAAYDYKGALDILNRYPDFNSAVCLAALGYDEQALLLLDKLQPATGRMEYLRAIIYSRAKRYEEARATLLSSARKDMQLAFKAEIEPEFEPLFEAYPDLQTILLAIADGEEY